MREFDEDAVAAGTLEVDDPYFGDGGRLRARAWSRWSGPARASSRTCGSALAASRPVSAAAARPNTSTGLLIAVAGAVLFAVNGTVSKVALQSGLSSLELVSVRSAGAAVVLLGITAVLRPVGAAGGVARAALPRRLRRHRHRDGAVALLRRDPADAGRDRAAVRVHRPAAGRPLGAVRAAPAGALAPLAGAGLRAGRAGAGRRVLAGHGARPARAWSRRSARRRRSRRTTSMGEHGQRQRDPISLMGYSFGFSALLWAVVQPWWTFPFARLGAAVELPGALPGTTPLGRAGAVDRRARHRGAVPARAAGHPPPRSRAGRPRRDAGAGRRGDHRVGAARGVAERAAGGRVGSSCWSGSCSPRRPASRPAQARADPAAAPHPSPRAWPPDAPGPAAASPTFVPASSANRGLRTAGHAEPGARSRPRRGAGRWVAPGGSGCEGGAA